MSFLVKYEVNGYPAVYWTGDRWSERKSSAKSYPTQESGRQSLQVYGWAERVFSSGRVSFEEGH